MISDQEFGMWKQHEVTKKLYEALQAMREQIEEQMLNEAMLLNDRCQIELARLVGLREGIDIVLNAESIEYDDEES